MSETADQPADQPTDEVTDWLRGLLYTGVGLGVLAVNRLQVARRSAQKRLSTSSAKTSDDKSGAAAQSGGLPAGAVQALADILADPRKAQLLVGRLLEELQDIDDRVGGIENRFTNMLEDLEPDMPESAREISAAVRGLTHDHATQIRAVFGLRVR